MNCPDCDTPLDDASDRHRCTPATAHSQGRPRVVDNSVMIEKALDLPITCPDCEYEMEDPTDTHSCTPATAHSQGRPRVVPNWTMMRKVIE